MIDRTGWLGAAVLTLLLGACSSDGELLDGAIISDDNSDSATNVDDNDGSGNVTAEEFTGSQPSVSEIYSESQVQALQDLGLQINFGGNPPNVEGSYRIEPAILQASSIPGDSAPVGSQFLSKTIRFSNQDPDELTLDFSTINDQQVTVDGSDSYISGSGSAFTVFSRAQVTIDDVTFELTETYSGIVTAVGIESLQYTSFIEDSGGDDPSVIIPNNHGRLFIDGDGFSSSITTILD